MPNIIRDRNAVRGADLADLNHTYRALKGEPTHPGFTNRAAAEVQVGMAIMAAEDAAGHAGVPKGTQPKALTPQELQRANPYKEGTLSHQLHEAIASQQPIQRREAQPKEKSSRVTIHRVRATFAGTSKPQAGSTRNAVLLHLQSLPNATATVEELEAHFKQPVRGYLQKLVEKNHVEILGDEQ